MNSNSPFSLTETQVKLLELRQSVLLPLAREDRPAKASSIAAGKKIGLGYHMVCKLLQRYRASGDPLVFLGERKGRKAGCKLLRPQVEGIIQQAFNEIYAKRQRPRLKSVYQNIRLACSQRGIEPPSISTVRRRFNLADPEFVARRRHGSKNAQTLKPVKGQAPAAEYPLQIIEIDHTKADVILVDSVDHRPIGRPYITLAIDRYSRCIAGYLITLEAPSATSVGLCLANVAKDKSLILAEYGIDASWPLSGKPEMLYTDNGRDFTSKALSLGCLKHGIRLERRPVGQPWYGGTIERVIGTFMGAMHDELPGTTFSNVLNRGTYDSEGNACLTLKDLEEWILWRIVQYHATTHSTLGEPPLQRLLAGLEKGNPIDQIADLKTYFIDFLPIFRRHLQRDGFHIENIGYYGQKLDYYIARREQYPSGFQLRRDPRSLRCIWMRPPEGGPYIELPYRDITHPDISIWEYKQAQDDLKQRNKQFVDEDLIMRTIVARRKTTERAQESKRARRNQERRLQTRPVSELKPGGHAEVSPPTRPSTPLKPYDVEVDW